MSRDSDTSGDRLAATRRTVLGSLGAVGAGVGLSTFGAAPGSAQSSDPDYWTIVALPDTQEYAEAKTSDKPKVAQYAHDQTEWIAEHRDSENIAFVSHEGDVIDGYRDEEGKDAKIDAQWQFMDDVMSRLDGKVPYSTVTGNHDWKTWWDRSSSIAKYQEYFGPSRYEEYDWFGGAGPTNGDENRDELNTYQLFSAGGYDFIHLALEWEVPGSVDDPSTPLGWAQKVLDEHPDRAAILTTHSYLRGSPPKRAETVQETNGDGNHAQTVWEDLVAPNPQVFMVLSGHWHDASDGEARQVSENEADLPVYEIMANYQFRTQGGHGLFRRIEFRPGDGGDGNPDRIQVRTYSPRFDEYEDDENSEFGFDLDFDERFESWETLAGDADGDGDVDSDDVETVQRSISGEDVDIDEDAADVDGDGDIDIGDAVSVRNLSEGGS